MKKILNHLKIWIIGIIGAIITNTIVIELTKVNIVKCIGKGMLNFLEKIWVFLNFKIAIWLYALVLIILVIIIGIFYKLKKQKNEEPDFLKYCEDKYQNRVKFRWTYEKNFDGKYQMDNFVPICECGCELDEYNEIGNHFYGKEQYVCPKCGRQYGNTLSFQEMESFQKILFSNVQSGEYKQKIKK